MLTETQQICLFSSVISGSLCDLIWIKSILDRSFWGALCVSFPQVSIGVSVSEKRSAFRPIIEILDTGVTEKGKRHPSSCQINSLLGLNLCPFSVAGLEHKNVEKRKRQIRGALGAQFSAKNRDRLYTHSFCAEIWEIVAKEQLGPIHIPQAENGKTRPRDYNFRVPQQKLKGKIEATKKFDFS